ncbi:MAG: UDP-N-acetylmuramoyl-tripeptide--D-alanyl-D-alanine ligase [Betaproteobacteria bacterium]|jgi:UDP-N-acetylmuramoyl-tripeptide--D-alanyl-D-alanine ligase|nr:UDP-N-acetylmuramoyl-tripeptide--D-alanyl-D-alanine ligase [Betaproteobacteria bacterium]
MTPMMTLAAAAQAIGARVEGADIRFGSVSSDSRTLEPGALFVALRGERFDGHDYLSVARERGAAAAMIEAFAVERCAEAGLSALVVGDTRRALGDLARHWRGRFRIPLIAIVGSNGKTTVKEMTAACLRAHFGAAHVMATAGNLNNDIGVPLTLLGLRETHRVAVVELGMNHPGETAYLAGLVRPTIGLINNAQREHQEFMKSVADVAAEHAALLAALPADGIAVINADDEHAAVWRAAAGTRVVRDFGVGAGAAVRATHRPGDSGTALEIATPESRINVVLQVAGLHNIRNALAAAAAATAAGASLKSVAEGLASFRAVKGRLQQRGGRNATTIIDDSYNANPDSVRAAIDVLVRASGPRVLVLGDMGEVGEQGVAFHEEIGRHARDAGVTHLLALGPLVEHAVRAFGSGAMHFESLEALLEELEPNIVPGTTVLVKGSRFMRMERIVERLVEEAAACC